MATQISNNSPTMCLSTFSLPAEEPPKQKKKCCADNCKKRVTLVDFDCRCGKRYCSSHRLPETHSCTFDHVAAGKTQLTAQLVKVNGHDSKLERI